MDNSVMENRLGLGENIMETNTWLQNLPQIFFKAYIEYIKKNAFYKNKKQN